MKITFLCLVLPASVCLRSVPLSCSLLGFCVSFSPGGFFFLGSLSRSVLLPSEPFLVPPGLCGFRPFWLFLAVVPWFLSSFSLSFQFSVPLLLTSSPPCRWWFSLPSLAVPPLSRPVSSCVSSVACPVLGLPSVAGSCPFSFSVCLPSAMRCFFVAFLPSSFLPSRTLFPLPLCLSFSSLWVLSFPLFPIFSVGLFFGSLVCPLVWSVSPLGFCFPCSFQVSRSSSSRFISAFSY